MKGFLRARTITTILFIASIFAFSIYNFIYIGPSIWEEIKAIDLQVDTLKVTITSVENSISDKVAFKNEFVESYGFLQNVLGKNEFSNFNVIKDTDGMLHYTHFSEGANPVDVIGDRTIKFSKEMEKQRTELVYLMPPDKFIEDITQFPRGMPYHHNIDTMNAYLKVLEENDIDYIDFRSIVDSENGKTEDYFFKTDHHWRIETAFSAFCMLVEELNTKYDAKLDQEGFYRNLENYNKFVYPNSYMGSMSRKTGLIYGGVDDFTLIFPKFYTNYRFYTDSNNEQFETLGRFEEALIAPYPINGDLTYFDPMADKYFTYLWGNRPLVMVENLEIKDGLKILFVKDSFAVPMAAFLSEVCSKIDLIDPRYYQGDIVEFAKVNDYDYVFLSFSAPNLTEDFLHFLKTD